MSFVFGNVCLVSYQHIIMELLGAYLNPVRVGKSSSICFSSLTFIIHCYAVWARLNIVICSTLAYPTFFDIDDGSALRKTSKPHIGSLEPRTYGKRLVASASAGFVPEGTYLGLRESPMIKTINSKYPPGN